MTPQEIILRKSLVLNGSMSSADWELMSAGIKDRAFWVSRCESLDFVDTCHKTISDLLANAKGASGAVTSRAEVVSAIMQAARKAGLDTGSASITNHGSVARANVIIDTNAGMAAGYATAIQSNSYGARLAFPAQELVRIEERQVPRSWQNIWRQHGGKVYPGGRMIALKEDPIWSAISRFGNPYPPFDYNSGMGVDDVSYDEALKLGVLPSKHYQPPEESPIKSFNDKVEASMSMSGPDDAKFTNLVKVFGDQIQYNKHTKRAVFDGAMIHDVAKKVGDDFRAGKNTTDVKAKPTIGRPSSLFAEAAPSASKDAELRIPASNLMHIFQDHVGKDKDSRNVALTERELGLIGHIWRQPENVLDGKGGKKLLTKKDAFGNTYVLVVSVNSDAGINFHTFYKVKKGNPIKS